MEGPQTDGPGQLVEQVGSTLLAVGDLFSPRVIPERRPAAEKRCRREPLPAGPELPCPFRYNTHCRKCDASGSVAHGTCQVCGHLSSDSVEGPFSSSPSASMTSQSSLPAASGGGASKGLPIAEMFWEPCLGCEDEPSPAAPLARVSSPVATVEPLHPAARRSLFEESAAGPGECGGCEVPTAGLSPCSAVDEDASIPGTPHKVESEPTQEMKEMQDLCLGTADCGLQSLPSPIVCERDQEVTCILPLKSIRSTRTAPPQAAREEMVRIVPGGKSAIAAEIVPVPARIEQSTPWRATPCTPPCQPPPTRRPLRSSGPGLALSCPAPASTRADTNKQSLWTAACTVVFCTTVILMSLQMRKPMGAVERPAVLGRLDADLAAVGSPSEHELMARDNLFPTIARESTSILNVTARYLHASEPELHAEEDAGTQPWLSSLRTVKGNQELKGVKRDAADRSAPEEAMEAAVEEPATASSASQFSNGSMKVKKVACAWPSSSAPDDEGNMSWPYSPSLASLLPSMLSSEETDTAETDVTLPSRQRCGLSLQTSLLGRRQADDRAVRGLDIRQTSLMKAPKHSINWIHRKIVLGMYCKLYRYAAKVIVGVASKKTDLSWNPLTRIVTPPKFIVAMTDRMANVVVASANSTLELLDCTPRDLWHH